MMSTAPLRFDTTQIFHELDDWADDTELLDLVNTCVTMQQQAGLEHLRGQFVPNPQAAELVSPEALETILQDGKAISDVRTDREITNCLVFNSTNLAGAVLNEQLLRVRRAVDAAVAARLRRRFVEGPRLSVSDSGHFWYPPGAFMGWHTNIRTPGWRLYINYCEEPGKSFFRYRDPETGRMITSIDKQWNFRLFRITAEQPLWHAIYSETNRFSLGYMIKRQQVLPLPQRIARKLADAVLGRKATDGPYP